MIEFSTDLKQRCELAMVTGASIIVDPAQLRDLIEELHELRTHTNELEDEMTELKLALEESNWNLPL